MTPAYTPSDPTVSSEQWFSASTEAFHELRANLQSTEMMTMEHSTVEEFIQTTGTEVLRLLFQDHLDLRARTEQDVRDADNVLGSDGRERTHLRTRGRDLMTLFGPVRVTRKSYGGRGLTSLQPMDAELNLPESRFSHGVQRRVAVAAAQSSFDATVQALEMTSGASMGKRQAEQETARAAADFEEFYRTQERAAQAAREQTGSLMVLSVDGKGVPMRPEGLREATRQAAEQREAKLQTRRCKGEKRHARRMATVAAVYTTRSYPRRPEEVVGELRGVMDVEVKARRPRPEHKRVWASLQNSPAEVIESMFAEALARDPERAKHWVVLVDGDKTQLRLVQQTAERYGVTVATVLDLIHVIEYLWKAALVFHDEGSRDAEAWVGARLLALLQGRVSDVAAGIHRSATKRGLSESVREPADTCARYLLTYREYLRYDEYLAAGLPIATGVIEGACRHLVKDRMELTGARWGLEGAEGVLRLRSLRASGDFDQYWRFHLRNERLHNHIMSYAGYPPGTRPSSLPRQPGAPHLRVIR